MSKEKIVKKDYIHRQCVSSQAYLYNEILEHDLKVFVYI